MRSSSSQQNRKSKYEKSPHPPLSTFRWKVHFWGRLAPERSRCWYRFHWSFGWSLRRWLWSCCLWWWRTHLFFFRWGWGGCWHCPFLSNSHICNFCSRSDCVAFLCNNLCLSYNSLAWIKIVYFFIDSNSIMISQDCSSVKKVCQMVDWVDHRRFPSYVRRPWGTKDSRLSWYVPERLWSEVHEKLNRNESLEQDIIHSLTNCPQEAWHLYRFNFASNRAPHINCDLM